MKFNTNTVAVLKNFSSINPSIAMKKGNILRTISPQKSVIAIATLEQDFERDAAIYDLPRFLSTMSLFQDPDIAFNDSKFVIKDGRSRVNYTYASESMILTPPDREINLPSIDVDVELQWTDFDKILKAASVLKLPDIAFVGTPDGIRLAAVDVNNPSSDNFDIVLDSTHDEARHFTAVFRTENLKLIQADYQVQISSKGISKFYNDRVSYFIAVEQSSKF